MTTMTPLLDSLSRLSALPLGTVVHIGAGRGDHLAGYAALAPKRLVLVEGDPDNGAELQAAAKGLPGVELRAEVVAAAAGAVPWHRYNLRPLNGALDTTAALRAVYPRLALLGVRPVPAIGIADLLASLAISTPMAAGAGPAVLVLDVPGQEAALLAAVPAELLRAFEWLVVRRCREPLAASAAKPAASTATPATLTATLTATLAAQHFEPAGGDATTEPLWPVSVWRFDRQRFELGQLRERCAALEAQAASGATQLSAALATGQVLADEKARLLAECDRLAAEKTELATQRDALAKERSTLVVARDEQVKLATDRHKRITVLEAEAVDHKSRRQMLQDELAKAELQIEFIKDLLLREPTL